MSTSDYRDVHIIYLLKFVFQTDMPGLKAEKNICIVCQKKNKKSICNRQVFGSQSI